MSLVVLLSPPAMPADKLHCGCLADAAGLAEFSERHPPAVRYTVCLPVPGPVLVVHGVMSRSVHFMQCIVMDAPRAGEGHDGERMDPGLHAGRVSDPVCQHEQSRRPYRVGTTPCAFAHGRAPPPSAAQLGFSWDRRKFGGQAAIACGCGYVSLAGWNFCP